MAKWLNSGVSKAAPQNDSSGHEGTKGTKESISRLRVLRDFVAFGISQFCLSQSELSIARENWPKIVANRLFTSLTTSLPMLNV
jgi:hypothetical protein